MIKHLLATRYKKYLPGCQVSAFAVACLLQENNLLLMIGLSRCVAAETCRQALPKLQD